jgi:hypothetical protein
LLLAFIKGAQSVVHLLCIWCFHRPKNDFVDEEEDERDGWFALDVEGSPVVVVIVVGTGSVIL